MMFIIFRHLKKQNILLTTFYLIVTHVLVTFFMFISINDHFVYFRCRGWEVGGYACETTIGDQLGKHVYATKRLIGRRFDDPEVKKDM